MHILPRKHRRKTIMGAVVGVCVVAAAATAAHAGQPGVNEPTSQFGVRATVHLHDADRHNSDKCTHHPSRTVDLSNVPNGNFRQDFTLSDKCDEVTNHLDFQPMKNSDGSICFSWRAEFWENNGIHRVFPWATDCIGQDEATRRFANADGSDFKIGTSANFATFNFTVSNTGIAG